MSTETKDLEIAELEPRMGEINVKFKVIEKAEPNEVTSRSDGSTHRVSDATVGDTTGTVVIPLWDDTIDQMEIGKTYVLKNAHTGLFRGNLRLKFGRESVLEQADEDIEEVNEENDMSEVDHGRSRRNYGGRGRSSGGRSW
jgi:replication factor A1